MKQIKYALSIVGFAVLLAACNNVDFKKTRAGIPYKVFEGKGGKKIAQGNFVLFNIKIKVGDSVRYNSYLRSPEILKVDVPTISYDIKENLLEVFPKVKSGDSLYFVQSIDSVIAKNPMLLQQDTTIKKGQQIITTVKIVDVFKNEQEIQSYFDKQGKEQLVKDAKIVEAYLAKNNIQARKFGSGSYIQFSKEGTGPKVKKGDNVTLFYHGTTLEGQLFDSNVGKEAVTFQVMDGGLIKGFLEGLLEMNQGSKAKIFVPSALGYGSQGSPPVIAPNANLIFEIEIVKIAEGPKQPQMPMQSHPDTGSHEGHNHN
jgi:FKBP-type peptidyl-prolyl cis-trans isomerase FkpA